MGLVNMDQLHTQKIEQDTNTMGSARKVRVEYRKYCVNYVLLFSKFRMEYLLFVTKLHILNRYSDKNEDSKHSHGGISQLSPEKPPEQKHRGFPPITRHTPPFKHGNVSHLLAVVNIKNETMIEHTDTMNLAISIWVKLTFSINNLI